VRILLLTQWFNPEPTFKGLPFAKELVNLGHEVEVLTGFPNYPGGKVYKGYKIKLFQKEEMDGIRVIRVPIYPSHSAGTLKRIFNYLSFGISAIIIGNFLIKKPNVVYLFHSPASGLAAIFMRIFRRIPFVFDIQDLWPDSLSVTGMVKNRIAIKIVSKWCNFLYKKASKITVISPGFKKELISRGVDERKIQVIYNWCDEAHLHPSLNDKNLPKKLNVKSKFNIVFAGNMGKAQALGTVLNAAKIIKYKYKKIHFIFVGDGVELDDLKKLKLSLNLSNVQFLPKRPITEICDVLLIADILLVHLMDDPLFKITIPSKLQTYLAVGRPILIGVGGDAEDLVIKSDSGIACVPEDSKSIADSVIKLYNMSPAKRKKMGMNGKSFYEKELSIKSGVKKFEVIFKEILSEEL
jgi:glycosyltransferase involved in cell wall biosynthesis